MKLTKILIIISLLMFLTISVNAIPSETDILSCWDLETYGDGNFSDYVGNNPAAVVGGYSNQTDCVIGNCLTFAENNYYLSLPNNDLDFNMSTDFTMAAWVRSTNADALQSVLTVGRVQGPNEAVYMGFTGEGSPYDESALKVSSDGSTFQTNDFDSVLDLTLNSWQLWVWVKNGTDYSAYTNTSSGMSLSNQATLGTYKVYFTNSYEVTMGAGLYANDAVEVEFKGDMDEVTIWKRALTGAEISELYTQQYACSELYTGGAPAPYDSINISDVYPLGYSQFSNSTISFNFTFNASLYHTVNASLYINGTFNRSRNFTITTNGTNIYVEWNLTLPDRHYSYYVNLSDNESSEQTSTTTFFGVDTVPPDYTVAQINLSISYGYSLITGTINASDNNLWGMNITIDGTTVLFNKTNISGSSYIYNLSFNPKDYSLSYGVHSLVTEVSDSHTAQLIPDYNYRKDLLSNAITYNFNKGWVKISPEDDGLFSKFDTWKDKDRYVFNFQRDTLSRLLHGDRMRFVISSSGKLDLVDSKYPGHIVSMSLKKWIDFDSIYEGSIVTTERINENKILVTVDGIKEDNVLFKSIGGLNVVEKTYYFYYGNVTETYATNALETDSPEFILNFTTNISYVSDINASFYFNSSLYAPTKTTGTGYIQFSSSVYLGFVPSKNESNRTFYWNYTVTPVVDDEINNLTETHNQTVYRMIISQCSGDTTIKALNFTTINKSDASINSTMEVYFNLYNSSLSIKRSYGLEFINKPYFEYCILDNSLSTRTDYEALFKATNYVNKNYIINNGLLSSTIDNIQIEMDKTADTTEILITVVDENDLALEDYIIESYLYDLSENNYSLIDTKTTNSEGKSLFNLDVDRGEYLFYVKNSSGVVVYTEPKQTLTETEYTFRVILGTDIESIRLKLAQLDYTLTSNKNLESFNLTWDDSETDLIDNINLTIVRTNTTANTHIYSIKSTSDTGDLSYNVSANGVYVAQLYVTATENGQKYLIDTESLDIRAAYDVFDTDSLLISFIFIIVMAFVGLEISAEISFVLAIIGMVIFYLLGFIAVSASGLISLIISIGIIAYRLKQR